MEPVLSPNLDHFLLVDNFWFRQNKRMCFHTLTLNIVFLFLVSIGCAYKTLCIFLLALSSKAKACFCCSRWWLCFCWEAGVVESSSGSGNIRTPITERLSEIVCCRDPLHWTLLYCPCAVYSSGVSNCYLCILVCFQVQQWDRLHCIWETPETECFGGGLWRSLSKRVWV